MLNGYFRNVIIATQQNTALECRATCGSCNGMFSRPKSIIYDKSFVYFCLTIISDFYLCGRKAVDFFLGETSRALKHEDNRQSAFEENFQIYIYISYTIIRVKIVCMYVCMYIYIYVSGNFLQKRSNDFLHVLMHDLFHLKKNLHLFGPTNKNRN